MPRESKIAEDKNMFEARALRLIHQCFKGRQRKRSQ